MAILTEDNRRLFTYFFEMLPLSSIFGQIFAFDFLDFLFQDTLMAFYCGIFLTSLVPAAGSKK